MVHICSLMPERLRQVDCEFEVSPGYRVKLHKQTNKKKTLNNNLPPNLQRNQLNDT